MPQEPYYAADEMWTGVEDTRRLWPWVVAAILIVLAVISVIAAVVIAFAR